MKLFDLGGKDEKSDAPGLSNRAGGRFLCSWQRAADTWFKPP